MIVNLSSWCVEKHPFGVSRFYFRQALQCMSSWPLVNRNKVEDSKVILSVQGIAQLADPKLSTLAQKVRRTILPGPVDFNCCSARYSLGEFAVVQSDT